MYLEHFNLKTAPFMLTPNTQFFYQLAGHHIALNTVLLHLRQGEGFIKITGKIGTGKTLLCRLLLQELGDHFVTAYIHNPSVEASVLYKSVALELGIPAEELQNSQQVSIAIHEKLIQIHAQGKQVVLLIDEAQALPMESLEAVRLLTNLETQTTKLLQIVLFGQPELTTRLKQVSMRQLRQRISFSCDLPPLKYSELKAYLCHRLTIAGYSAAQPLFTGCARLYLFYKSKAIPRLIHILCHKSMMSAYGRGKLKVHLHDMHQAIKDTESVAPPVAPIICGIVLAILAGYALYLWRI